MSIGFWRVSDCTSVRCMVLAFLTVNFSSGVTPSSSSPRAADGLDVLRPEVDQRDVVAGMRQRSADIAAQRADADDCNPLAHFVPPSVCSTHRVIPSEARVAALILALLGMTRFYAAERAERLDRLIETRGLVQVGRMARVGNHHLGRSLDLGRHVVGGGEEIRVVGAHEHQRRHLDAVERLDHPVVLLRQHAARRAGEAGRVAMAGQPHLVGAVERRQTARVEVGGALVRRLVPLRPRLVLLEAGAGVEQHQRAHPLGMAGMEGERHVAAERQAGDDRRLRPDQVEQRRHVADRQRLGVLRAVLGIVALAVAAEVPDDHLVAVLQRRDLIVPHARGRAVAVAQQDRRSLPVDLVVDRDAVAVELGHQGFTRASLRAFSR